MERNIYPFSSFSFFSNLQWIECCSLMLISSGNSLIDILRNYVLPATGNPLSQSPKHIQLTITPLFPVFVIGCIISASDVFLLKKIAEILQMEDNLDKYKVLLSQIFFLKLCCAFVLPSLHLSALQMLVWMAI